MLGNSKIDSEIKSEFESTRDTLQRQIDKKKAVVDFLQENFFSYECDMGYNRNKYFSVPAHPFSSLSYNWKYMIEICDENQRVIDLFKKVYGELTDLEKQLNKLKSDYQNWRNQ